MHQSSSAGQSVAIRLETVDMTSSPVSSVDPGETFLLRAFVEDTRDPAKGVFQAFMDVTYSSSAVTPAGAILFGADFPNARRGDTSVPGLVDEIGGLGGFSAPGPGELLLFAIPFQAHAEGRALFFSDPADVAGNQVLLHGLNREIPFDQIEYGSASLVIGNLLPGDTNGDGRVDITDLNNVRNHFGATGSGNPPLPGDTFPFDGVVDIVDLNAVRNNFGASSATVPEPAAGLLAMLAALWLTPWASRRRWR